MSPNSPFLETNIYDPPKLIAGTMQIGEWFAQVTMLGNDQARFRPGLERAWEPQTPLSTASHCKEGTLPICCLSHLLLPRHTWCVSIPIPVPKASLLFLDLMLVCHNPCSSRVGLFWPSNCLQEPPAATDFFSSWLLVYHTQTQM